MCIDEENIILKSTLRCLQHSTSLVGALPEQLPASSEKVATRRGGACIMSAPVTDKQHGFREKKVRQQSWRYVIPHTVINILFVTVFAK